MPRLTSPFGLYWQSRKETVSLSESFSQAVRRAPLNHYQGDHQA